MCTIEELSSKIDLISKQLQCIMKQLEQTINIQQDDNHVTQQYSERFLTNLEAVFEEFDFNRVHKVMKHLHWHWGDHVPNIIELKDTADRLLKKCYYSVIDKGEKSIMGTGGFRAEVDEEFNCTLEFIVEEYSTIL